MVPDGTEAALDDHPNTSALAPGGCFPTTVAALRGTDARDRQPIFVLTTATLDDPRPIPLS
jgi:hypothetical protein